MTSVCGAPLPAWKAANGYYKYLWWGQIRAGGTYVLNARGGMGQQWIYVSTSDGVVIVRSGLVEGGVDRWPDVFEGVTASCGDPAPRRCAGGARGARVCAHRSARRPGTLAGS